MDLVGEFHPPSAQGHKYALTAICMLTGYVFCIPIPSKTAAKVIQTYVDHIYAKFGGSFKILSDNGTEFKNKLFEEIAKTLGVAHKKYTAPYHPASNGRIEGFHNFLKACIAKHVSKTLEWDQVVPLACAAYNFMPNEHSKESPFFMMFARDPILPLNTMLKPRLRYLGDEANMISLEALKNMLEIAATNLKKARQRKYPNQPHLPTKLKEGDTVMIKNHTAGPFDPHYIGDYRVIKKSGNQIELRPAEGGKSKWEHIKYVKYIFPADRYINQLPDYTSFGRKSTLRLNPDKIPDLKWDFPTSLHTDNIGGTVVTTNYIQTNTVSQVTLSGQGGTTQSIVRPICSILQCTPTRKLDQAT